MAIKINANMSNDNKQMLVNWIPRLLKCFSAFNCKMEVLEAYIGRSFAQFTVVDLNKTRFNEFMMEKLTDAVNAEFGIKNADIYPDVVNPDYALGIQIPLAKREVLSFSSANASKEFVEGNRYTFVVGESVKDRIVSCNLLSDKRLLIGGMANAGKTVFLNSMICSLLQKNNADTLKLVLMDKKGKVFKNYVELPHLLFHGVVFDDYGAKEAFDWLKSELEWRKVLFSRNGCRNLDEYNRYAQMAKEDSFAGIMVVIDELSDWVTDSFLKILFEVLSIKETAELGIFFAVATQKPAIAYLGDSLKEMFPAKIVFKCDTPANSRILFGKTTAVKLQGDGDLFYRKNDTNKISRLQAPYITQEDISDTLVRFDIRLD